MDSQSQLTASFRLFLNLAFMCMDILSLSNMLIGDPSLSACTWTQKASISSRLQLEAGQGPATVEGVCVRKASIVPSGSQREYPPLGYPVEQTRSCPHFLAHIAGTVILPF